VTGREIGREGWRESERKQEVRVGRPPTPTCGFRVQGSGFRVEG